MSWFSLIILVRTKLLAFINSVLCGTLTSEDENKNFGLAGVGVKVAATFLINSKNQSVGGSTSSLRVDIDGPNKSDKLLGK